MYGCICMVVYINVCMVVCMYGCMVVSMYVYLYVGWLCMVVCMYSCTYIYIYICMHACIFMCVYLCLYICVLFLMCWCCICFNNWHYFQSLSSSSLSSLLPLLFICIDLRGNSFWSDETFQRVTIHFVSYGA